MGEKRLGGGVIIFFKVEHTDIGINFNILVAICTDFSIYAMFSFYKNGIMCTYHAYVNKKTFIIIFYTINKALLHIVSYLILTITWENKYFYYNVHFTIENTEG